jgi:hypothetical protein
VDRYATLTAERGIRRTTLHIPYVNGTGKNAHSLVRRIQWTIINQVFFARSLLWDDATSGGILLHSGLRPVAALFGLMTQRKGIR